MSDDRATQISARLAAATPGPWVKTRFNVVDMGTPQPATFAVVTHTDRRPSRPVLEANSDLIANAPADLAWLLAERVELLRRAETAERAGSYDNLVTMLERAERERDEAQSEMERIASHTRDAYDQRDAAQEALAASEAKVARVEASLVETRRRLLDTAWSSDQEDRVRVAVLHLDAAMEGRANPLADPTPAAPCPRETPFKSYTEPTCSRPEGHAGGCLFNSHDGRTPLEVMPK